MVDTSQIWTPTANCALCWDNRTHSQDLVCNGCSSVVRTFPVENIQQSATTLSYLKREIEDLNQGELRFPQHSIHLLTEPQFINVIEKQIWYALFICLRQQCLRFLLKNTWAEWVLVETGAWMCILAHCIAEHLAVFWFLQSVQQTRKEGVGYTTTDVSTASYFRTMPYSQKIPE